MKFENDYISSGIIKRHMPSSMFEHVLDVLRNEKPINLFFAQNHGLLGTGSKPVGEGK